MNIIYITAKKFLGKDISKTQQELGCVESLSFVLDKAGIPFNENLSTIRFNAEIKQDSRFVQVSQPQKGDIIISPTSGKIGHAGVISDNNKVMSNNSRDSKWSEHLNLFKWKIQYKGLSTFYYRYLPNVETLKKQKISLLKTVIGLMLKLVGILKRKIAKKVGGNNLGTTMKKEIITLIQCPMHEKNRCCGTLNGKINKSTIDFYCNECGFEAGYIAKDQFKKLDTA